MARRSSLPNLIVDAFEHSEATASGNNWRGVRMGNYVGVEHHGTHMFNVTRAGIVEPVDRGHGSASDRCGVRRITAGFGCGSPQGIGFRELYDDEPMNRMSGDQWRSAIQRDPILRETPNRTQGVGGATSTEITFGPIGDRPDTDTSDYVPLPQGQAARRRGWSDVSSDAEWSPSRTRGANTHSGLPEDDFQYSDLNRRGPDYSQPDPFDFSDPEEARQSQSITDMEETLRGLDERSQRPRNEQ
jgi:hypothetical protein